MPTEFSWEKLTLFGRKIFQILDITIIYLKGTWRILWIRIGKRDVLLLKYNVHLVTLYWGSLFFYLFSNFQLLRRYLTWSWLLFVLLCCCLLVSCIDIRYAKHNKRSCYLAYTGLFIIPWNISKIHNQYTTQLIMVVLTLIERETLQVIFTYFTDAQCVHLW